MSAVEKRAPRSLLRSSWQVVTDETLSTYARSAGLIGNSIPAIVCHFEEQTSKGIMWRDIGLGNWLFALDKEEDHQGIAPAVLTLAKDPAAAKAKPAKARAFVEQRQWETMAEMKRHLPN